ncbi:centrosome and spindle pole-associated protein 1 isoform X5 [Salmo trutta]|uniref:centrosome and spindle pole-associated protein 1 isoform X5 n=1 Tax=Salmo trutta TaxID=8032 RepID=UPI0011325E21|nr:centrosome and spindle pole-associated protein 1-like isoform X5 [Salmo trutta]
MEMDDELEKFIQQQKARVAEDKASLEQDPPYLEIRTKDYKANDPTFTNIPTFKSSTAQGKEENCCLSLPLGEDYERKKQKLQQELRLDYRRYVTQKKHLNAAEPDPSLPLGERRAAKEQLASLRAPPDLPVVHCSPRPPVHPKRAPSMRDAATLTEGRRGLHRGGRCLVEGRRMEGLWPEDELLLPRERARLVRVDFDSEADLTEEELDLMVRRRPRQTRLEREERTWQRRHYKTDLRDISRLRDRGAELPDDYTESSQYAYRKETNGSVVPDEDYSQASRGTSSLTPKPKLQVPAGMRPSGRSRSSTKKDELEFATGLMIGAADAAAALQVRKERYRQELQEQIAEQQRNRKREKDLELRVAVTETTDPEKKADRIKQFGAVTSDDHARKRKDSWYPPGQAVDQPVDELNGRPSEENRERLPPEQPGVALQSPLLDYSHTLGLSGGISPYSQAIHRSMDTPRMAGFRPHPPSTLADAYRSPSVEAHLYHGARNPLDPNLAYYGQIPLTGGVQPMSYLSLPPAGPHPSQMGQHSPHSHYNGSSHPEPPPQPASDAATMGSGIGVFPAEQVKPSKESVLSYKEALRQQIQERRERRRLDREETDRYEAKLEADMKNHDPWGRGGGGAPLRDSRGNLITDLHQMHKHNEEAYINPETWQKSARAIMAVPQEEDTRPPSTHRVSGFAQAPSFARGSIFGNLPTPQQLHEQEKYKAYLKQQIEEKRKKEAEERESQRLEEEKEEKRLAEQRERIQREYEEEQDRKKRKEMDQKAKNDELIRLAEERKKEVERMKKEAEEKENSALRKQYEKERRARLQEVPREPSPPIPTLQKRHQAPQYSPRPPSMDSHRATTVPLSERSLSGLQSPPVPARRNQLRAAEDQRGVISELSELRRQLRSEQKRLESQLLQSEWEELDSPMSDRHRDRERPQVDVFDMARLRLQAPVRRPSSRNTEPNNLHRIHDSLQLRYRDVDSSEVEGHGYCEHPSDRDGQSVHIQRQADYREELRRINNSLRRKPAADYFDLSPPQQHNHYLVSFYLPVCLAIALNHRVVSLLYSTCLSVCDTKPVHSSPQRNAVGDPMRGSLLESDSAFIDPMGEAFPVSPPPVQKPQLSARERRRLAKRADLHNERGSSREPVGQPENSYCQSEASLNTQQHDRERNHHRTKRLLAMGRHGLRRADLSGDEDMSPQVSPRAPHTQGSVDTVAMEPWMRPGTSETLKRLMTGQTPCRERLASRESTVQDWEGPSTYHG